MGRKCHQTKTSIRDADVDCVQEGEAKELQMCSSIGRCLELVSTDEPAGDECSACMTCSEEVRIGRTEEELVEHCYGAL